MEQRVGLITLGVAGPGRSRAFYESLGRRGQEVAPKDVDALLAAAQEAARNPGFPQA